MKAIDLSEVRSIEDSSYKFPWSNRIFLDCLAAGYKCLIVEVSSKVAGYCIVALAADEVHILNICVGPEFRRMGCAQHLIENEIKTAERSNSGSIYLEVRVSNIAAIRLYKKLGFKKMGLRKGYYPSEEGREDAYIYSLALEGSKTHISNLNLYV